MEIRIKAAEEAVKILTATQTVPTQPATVPTQSAAVAAKLATVKPEHTLLANPVRVLPLPSLINDLRSPSTSPQPPSGRVSQVKSTSAQTGPPNLPAKRPSEEVEEEEVT